jgi:membrane-associated phospholipid phosphatase
LNIQHLANDKQIQSGFSGKEKNSFGSADPQKIVASIFAARMAYNITSGFFSDEDRGYQDFKHAFLFYKAFIYSRTFTEFVKNFTNRKRPNGVDNRSFFSGHASMTFTASAFLYRELSDYIDELPIAYNDPFLCTALKAAAFTGLYGWAAYVGYSRIYDNKHYFSDVLVGAVVGTLIGNWVYSSYLDNEKGFLNKLSLGMVNNQPSLNFLLQF